jgi:hypothetical protein
MSHLFVSTLAEIHERYEKIDFMQNQISELQQELVAYQESLIPYQQEEAQIREAKSACESALEQIKTALALTAQIRNGVYLPDFKEEVNTILNLEYQHKLIFNSTELNNRFLDIKLRLAEQGLLVGDELKNTYVAKVWSITFLSEISAKNLAGSRINSQLLATDCEHGWNLTWVLDQPRLVWCPEVQRQPVFKLLTEYDQFDAIKNALALNEITITTLLSDRDKAKRWTVEWNGQAAILFWQSWFCASWSIEAVADQKELSGIWENFDLYDYLSGNGVDVDDTWYND